MTDLLNNWAVEYLQARHDKPFLLYLSHKAVHAPFLPAKRHENLYADKTYEVPLSAKDDLKGKPALIREIAPVDVLQIPGATPEPGEPRYGRSSSKQEIFLDHLRCLSSVDEGIGRLFDILEDSGQLNNTLIIFASDNGFLFGEHGLFMNKRVPYEASLRIPLLMRYPRLIKSGMTLDQLVLNIDIAPTLYDLVGVEAPIPIHGKSLLPIFNDAAYELRTEFLAEYYLEKITPLYATWQALRTDQWKYIRYPELPGMDELYDLQNDPGELNNLISHPDYHLTFEKLQNNLKRRLEDSEGTY
jgi:N-acetylglucosamine-6-sulfatase